ncbi:MAG: hypothetical protein ACI9CA_001818 [Natronomonas sp.]|jgi:hypothetical protein
MEETAIDRLLRDERLNAVLGWVVAAGVGLTAVGSVLAGDLLWGVFAATVAIVMLLPPLVFADPGVMLPWEVLVLAGLPVLGRSVATLQVASRVGTYLSVAALALIVAVELHAFTAVSMSPSFAVAFVAVATMGVAGVWAVLRWTVDLWLGTGFLLDPTLSEHAIERGLMLEFVASTVAGVLAGVVFEFYIRRRAGVRRRLGVD